MKTVVVVATAWLLIAGLALIQLWPYIPQTTAQWVLFIVFAAPAYVLIEASGEWAFGEHRKISDAGRLALVAAIVIGVGGLVVLFT